jgi:hypothetical protein
VVKYRGTFDLVTGSVTMSAPAHLNGAAAVPWFRFVGGAEGLPWQLLAVAGEGKVEDISDKLLLFIYADHILVQLKA